MPITWKNVGSNTAAAAAASSRAMETASNMQNNALSSLEDMAKMQRDTQIANVAQGRENRTDDILNTLSGFKTAEEAQNFRESGGLEQLLANPRSYNQDEVRGQFESRLNSLHTSDKATIDRNEAELQRELRPILSEGNALITANDELGYAKWAETNKERLIEGGQWGKITATKTKQDQFERDTAFSNDSNLRKRKKWKEDDEATAIEEASNSLVSAFGQDIDNLSNGVGGTVANDFTEMINGAQARFVRDNPTATEDQKTANYQRLQGAVNRRTTRSDADIAVDAAELGAIERKFKSNSVVQSRNIDKAVAANEAMKSVFGDDKVPWDMSEAVAEIMKSGVTITGEDNVEQQVELSPAHIEMFLRQAKGAWKKDSWDFKSAITNFAGSPGVIADNKGAIEYDRRKQQLTSRANSGLRFEDLNQVGPIQVEAERNLTDVNQLLRDSLVPIGVTAERVGDAEVSRGPRTQGQILVDTVTDVLGKVGDIASNIGNTNLEDVNAPTLVLMRELAADDEQRKKIDQILQERSQL